MNFKWSEKIPFPDKATQEGWEGAVFVYAPRWVPKWLLHKLIEINMITMRTGPQPTNADFNGSDSGYYGYSRAWKSVIVNGKAPLEDSLD